MQYEPAVLAANVELFINRANSDTIQIANMCAGINNKRATMVEISIRQLQASDQQAFLTASMASVDLHQSLIVAPTTENDFKKYLTKYKDERNFCFLVLANNELAGVVNLNEVVRGVFRSAYSGYFVFKGFESRGVMTAGLKQVIQHAFEVLDLHRIEANVQPSNAPSVALVKRCGFKKEGYSPKYLFIDNQWRDHERWAILADD
ncbi:MAG: GNAT family N-acetyltransferase [Coxiellaceae bacterium]|nr:GNAT family N-acetyltransferase [Coxiellaceae bacterium]